MVIRRSLTALFALLVAIGTVTASAQRPDHGSGRSAEPDASGTPVTVSACAGVDQYLDDLDAVLADEGPFVDFIFSTVEFQDLSRSEAEEIIADGDEVIVAMNEIDVPEPYIPGHEGIVLFLQNMIDFTRFYGLDSSSVPDVLAYDEAMLGIYQGEMALAGACPDEVEQNGGYVFMDPETLEDEYGADDEADRS